MKNTQFTKYKVQLNARKLLFFIAFLFLVESTYAQCAMCKAVTKTNDQSGENQVGKGVNRGVLYLLSVPYLLAGVGVLIWYRNKKAGEKNSPIDL